MMPSQVPQPVHRANWRLRFGRAYFTNKRRLAWWLQAKGLATQRVHERLEYTLFEHATPMLRELSGVDMQLQRNKKASLSIAASCVDGVVLHPGETFSFWRLVGKPTAKRGFKVGLALRNGTIQQDIGGGLCQMTNLIYWMTIHTPLTITERWRHGYDVFPDASRTQPFATGATCAYNYIDLQIRNDTPHTYQLLVFTKGDWLHGAWLCDAPAKLHYRIEERDHRINMEYWGGYSRHNEIWRNIFDANTNARLGEEFVSANHAIMMYEPLLAAPEDTPT